MAILPIILVNGTTADANDVMADFNELYSNIDPSNVAAGNKTGTGKFVLETALTAAIGAPVPIGTIIPFYDFNGALTFSATQWAYCNGQSKTVGSIGAQTLPDISGRYLVGFGTDGGGDNGSAAWATAAVGNASHQINIAHSHTVNGHTHTGPSHTHDSGNLQFDIAVISLSVGGSFNLLMYDSGGSGFNIVKNTQLSVAGGATSICTNDAASIGSGVTKTLYTKTGSGATGSSGTGATGSTSPGTNSQLSSTQSIQPSSIRVRWLMRIL